VKWNLVEVEWERGENITMIEELQNKKLNGSRFY
jgi:hypothetical protein